jgi:hypothetical protein
MRSKLARWTGKSGVVGAMALGYVVTMAPASHAVAASGEAGLYDAFGNVGTGVLETAGAVVAAVLAIALIRNLSVRRSTRLAEQRHQERLRDRERPVKVLRSRFGAGMVPAEPPIAAPRAPAVPVMYLGLTNDYPAVSASQVAPQPSAPPTPVPQSFVSQQFVSQSFMSQSFMSQSFIQKPRPIAPLMVLPQSYAPTPFASQQLPAQFLAQQPSQSPHSSQPVAAQPIVPQSAGPWPAASTPAADAYPSYRPEALRYIPPGSPNW